MRQCNICKYPAKIKYKEINKETGVLEEREHMVQCPGHIGIHPALWNRDPDYESLRKSYLKHRTKGGRKNNKE